MSHQAVETRHAAVPQFVDILHPTMTPRTAQPHHRRFVGEFHTLSDRHNYHWTLDSMVVNSNPWPPGV